MMTKERSMKILNFMILGTGVLLLRRGNISHTVKMHFFPLKIFFSAPGYMSPSEKSLK